MQRPLSDRGITSFNDSSSNSVYGLGHSNYHTTPNLIVDRPKEQAQQYHQRYTSSGSASPSISQSLDHPPSTLSSASGASGQSTASSTVGSPYSLATHSLTSQDAWSEPNQGLGIAPDIVHNDGFTQDIFSSSSLENDLCFQGGKFPDNFVGESGIFSSISCSPSFPEFEASLIRGNTSSLLHSPLPQSLPNTIDPFVMFCNISGRQEPFKPPVQPASKSYPILRRVASPRRNARAQNQTQCHSPQNLFSNQSNGGFIAPLESSCRFSSSFLFVILLNLRLHIRRLS